MNTKEHIQDKIIQIRVLTKINRAILHLRIQQVDNESNQLGLMLRINLKTKDLKEKHYHHL